VKAPPTDLEQLAQRLVAQSAAVKEGEIVLVSGGPENIELLENIAVQVRKAGAFPLVTVSTDRLAKRLYTDVPEKYDSQTDQLALKLAEVVNVAIAAAGLVLAQGTSCQAGRIFFALPSFVAIASLLTAVVLLLPRRKAQKGKAGLPYGLDDAIAFFDQLSASTDRLGFKRVDYALVNDRGPGLEVAGGRTRGVIVFVRRWLVDALLHGLTPNARA
jgi:hypothetical protein